MFARMVFSISSIIRPIFAMCVFVSFTALVSSACEKLLEVSYIFLFANTEIILLNVFSASGNHHIIFDRGGHLTF